MASLRAEIIARGATMLLRLNESSGTLADATGNGHSGTKQANVTLGAAALVSTDTSADFTGSTPSYVDVADHAAFDIGTGGTSPFSILFVIKRGTTAADVTVISKGNSGGDGFAIRFAAGGSFLVFGNASRANDNCYSGITQDTARHMYLFTWDPTIHGKWYEDAVDLAATTDASLNTVDNAQTLRLGADNPTEANDLDATLAYVAFFPSALTAGDATALYAAIDNALEPSDAANAFQFGAFQDGAFQTPIQNAFQQNAFQNGAFQLPFDDPNQTVTPSTVALTTATFAPVIASTIVSGQATLTLTTFAPVIALSVVPSTLSLTLTTFAPTVTATANQTVTPGVLALTLTTFAPVIALSVIPTTASLTLTTFAPVVALGVIPATAALTTTTFAPVIGLGIVPATASLTLTAFAPTVATPVLCTPATLALTITTFAPTVSAGAGLTITPDTLALAMTAFAPSIVLSDNQTVTPSTLALLTAAFAPTVSTPVLTTPDTASLVLGPFAPTVTTSDNQTVVPGPLGLTLTGYAPVVGGVGIGVVGKVIGGSVSLIRSLGSAAIPRSGGSVDRPVPGGDVSQPKPGGSVDEV